MPASVCFALQRPSCILLHLLYALLAQHRTLPEFSLDGKVAPVGKHALVHVYMCDGQHASVDPFPTILTRCKRILIIHSVSQGLGKQILAAIILFGAHGAVVDLKQDRAAKGYLFETVGGHAPISTIRPKKSCIHLARSC
jgi:hypothetical protein